MTYFFAHYVGGDAMNNNDNCAIRGRVDANVFSALKIILAFIHKCQTNVALSHKYNIYRAYRNVENSDSGFIVIHNFMASTYYLRI